MGKKVSFQITSLIKGSSTCGAFVWRFLFRFEASKGLILHKLAVLKYYCTFSYRNAHLEISVLDTTESSRGRTGDCLPRPVLPEKGYFIVTFGHFGLLGLTESGRRAVPPLRDCRAAPPGCLAAPRLPPPRQGWSPQRKTPRSGGVDEATRGARSPPPTASPPALSPSPAAAVLALLSLNRGGNRRPLSPLGEAGSRPSLPSAPEPRPPGSGRPYPAGAGPRRGPTRGGVRGAPDSPACVGFCGPPGSWTGRSPSRTPGT